MTHQEMLQNAIRSYFDGQRFGAIVGGIIALLILAFAGMTFLRGDGFLKGLALILALFAITAGGSGVSLTIRDSKNIGVLMQASPNVIQHETERMEKVVDSYRFYRVAFIGVAIAAIVILISIRSPFWQGFAVGLLILAALGVGIDHFDRQHAVTYLMALKS
jgi:glucan phosphoethanolaminetransferase (alkaline phosphatase superfamily)